MTEEDSAIVPMIFGNMELLVRLLIEEGVKQVVADLPAYPLGRRRVLSLDESQKMLDFISGLHRKGTPLKTAKFRASQKYGCSLRTVERLWSKWDSIPAPEFRADDALKYLAHLD